MNIVLIMYKVENLRHIRFVFCILILFRTVPVISFLPKIKCTSIQVIKKVKPCAGQSRKCLYLHDSSRFIDGPPIETKPEYESIHGPLGKTVDDLFLSTFRTQMADKVGVDSKLPKVRNSLSAYLIVVNYFS